MVKKPKKLIKTEKKEEGTYQQVYWQDTHD